MSAGRIVRLIALPTLGSLLLAFSGCATGGTTPLAAGLNSPAGGGSLGAGAGGSSGGGGSSTSGSGTAKAFLSGKAFGGQQAVGGATVTLWAAGVTGTYGTGASSIATTTTASDGTGFFSFNNAGVSPCTTGQYLYITVTGGNSGGGANQYLALMAALPNPCGPSTAGTFLNINEITTVASVTALQQFIGITPGGSPAWMVGAPSANVTGMANAFTQVANLVNISTGTSAASTAMNIVSSVTYTTTITPDTNKINTFANVLAACVNTNGNSQCTSLFSDTTPSGSPAPTDTIQAAYYMATNAAGLTMPAHGVAGSPSWLCSQYSVSNPPFSTTTACNDTTTGTYPTDWTVDVNWNTSNGTSTVGTANTASVAIDASGNIWTAALNTSATGLGVTEFNPAGQVQFTPATTAPIAGGWNYSSTCVNNNTCSAAASLGGTRQGDALAIDTSGNAWASSYYGSTYTIVTSQPQEVVVQVAPGTGTANAYLVGSFPNGVAIDGNNNLYVGDDSSTTTNRYYWAELLASGSPAYHTFETGTGRTAGNGDYYIGGSVDETANGYVWPWSTPCQTTIPRITNTPSPGTASTVGSTTALPAAACFIAADASGNAWVSAAPGGSAGVTALEYVNIGTSIVSPTVTTFTQGLNGVASGSQLGGGLYSPEGLAIDGTGNLWVVNANGTGSASTGGGISEFAPSANGTVLTPLSPSGSGVWGFFSNTTIGAPTGAAIDASGNVWFKTRNGSNLYYLVGAASPVVTPLSTMAKTGFIAERPGATQLASVTSSLSFSALTTGSQSQTVTVTNTGTAAIKITGTSFSGANPGDFSVNTGASTCGSTLGIGANCQFTVKFTSSVAGTFTAAMSVNTTAVVTPSSTALTGTADTQTGSSLGLGTGTAPSGTTLAFGTIVAGSTTTGQAVQLTNSGASSINLNLAASGTGINLFPELTTCGSSLASGASCFVGFKFAPKVAGTYSGMLTITDTGDSGSTLVPISGTATPFTITLNTSSATAWVIDNGAITFNWNTNSAYLNSWVLDGYSDQLVDVTTLGSGSQIEGLYSGMVGPFMNGTPTSSCTAVGVTVTGPTTCAAGSGTTPYLDWAITWLDSGSPTLNDYTFVWHYLVFPNDPGVHTYVQLVHNASNTNPVAGGVGQIQWIFRDNQSIFTHTYEVNSSLGWLGAEDIPLPSVADMASSDPGRTVQNAAEDLHGFTDIPSGFGREFMTKYDYAGYEYLEQAHGLYGPASSGTTYGVWTVVPKLETFVGGPTKQNLWFTENIDMIEAYSNHEDNNLSLTTPTGVASNRLFGPYYIHVNTLGTAYNQTGTQLASQGDMYADAISAESGLVSNYDVIDPLVAAGYTTSTGRGTVSIQMNGVTGAPHTAWAVLSDPNTNFQYSAQGMQYWADISSTGSATITGVVPGTYRLSVYVLGQWGEYRLDGITVTANNTTTVPTATFVPETFTNVNGNASGETVFTIGTPDRSSHEFLHGHNTNTGNDDREFWGAWNYWGDFTANQGAVVYYATAVGSTPATNDLSKWNYTHWNFFNPGLYAGVFSSSDDTTDGYSAYPGQTYSGILGVGAESAIPTYVATLPGETGTNGAGTAVPAWQVYFATPSDIASYGSGYVQLSIAMSCGYSSYVVNLNPSGANVQRIWHYTNYSDCMIRSGLSGYTEWFVMEFPASALNQTPGGSNEITMSMSSSGNGVEDDALRLELTNNTSNPTSTGWNDYTYITGTGTPATPPSSPNSSGLYNNDATGNPNPNP